MSADMEKRLHFWILKVKVKLISMNHAAVYQFLNVYSENKDVLWGGQQITMLKK